MRAPKVVSGPTMFQVIQSLLGTETGESRHKVSFITDEGHTITARVMLVSKDERLNMANQPLLIRGKIEGISHLEGYNFCGLPIDQLSGLHFTADYSSADQTGLISVEGVAFEQPSYEQRIHDAYVRSQNAFSPVM